MLKPMTQAMYSDLIGMDYCLGSSGETGCFDCYSLIIEIYKRRGVELNLEDFVVRTEEVREAYIDKLLVDNQWVTVDENDYQPGDLMLYMFDESNAGIVDHVGVLVTTSSMIHAGAKFGVVIEPTRKYSGWHWMAIRYIGEAEDKSYGADEVVPEDWTCEDE